MKNVPRLFFLGFAGVVCVVLLGLLLLYANYASGRSVPTFPRVTITITLPERTGVVNEPVVVVGEASDPDGIGSAELWVNGNKVASQANPNPSPSAFDISQSWIPDGAGNFLILLRGVDRKGFAGESSPVMIQIGERSAQPDPTLQVQYIVQAGDTLDSIAAQFGTTPDEIRRLNPGLGDLTPGASLYVPPMPEAPASAGAPPTPSGGGSAPPPAGGGSEEPPHVSAPPPPSPEGGAPAEPASSPPWVAALPAAVYCVVSPAACSAPIGDAAPLPPASDVHASLTDGCTVSVSWTDNSSVEAGYRVYRLVMRPRFRSDLLELVDPAPGSGTRLTYADTSVPTGQFFYAIVTINARGEEVWSAPSEEITSTCPSSAAISGRSIDVEALDMTVGDSSIDRLYCFVSLVAPPFERIPAGASDFITLEGGTWNIAAYASGENKRTLLVDGSRPLDIEVECRGRRGDTLVNLGRFTRSHRPEEWDGRRLTAGPDSGAFGVTYRIQSTPEGVSGATGAPVEDIAGATAALVDRTLPVPYNLSEGTSYMDCRIGGSHCTLREEPALEWRYSVDPVAPRPPLYFKVYTLDSAGGSPTFFYEDHVRAGETGAIGRAPQTAGCEHATYAVSAVVAVGPVRDPAHPRRPRPETESMMSTPLEVRSTTCGQLEITLQSLSVYGVGEGDHQWEAYGTFWFNHSPVIWDLGPCPADWLCGGAPSYTSVRANTVYNWADMDLSAPSSASIFAPVRRGPFGRGHNVFRLPIQGGQDLAWHFELRDQNGGGSAIWCGGPEAFRGYIALGGRSLAEWLAVNQDVVYNGADHGDGCSLYFHVRGIP